MNWARAVPGLLFCICFITSCFTNKYVLSVLKFTYPTLFQGWQSCTGALLLWVTGKLGWVEISTFPRSAAAYWLPGAVLFLGNIYGGSKALSMLSHTERGEHRDTSLQRLSWMRTISSVLILGSAVTLTLQNLQFGPDPYFWAFVHFCCVGSYRVFQKNFKSSHLSELEQQFINYVVSLLLLASAAHPTGDLFDVLEFPFRSSYKFYSGCFASGILGFFLLLAGVKLKTGPSLVHCAVWLFLAKILASGLSIFLFSTEFGLLTWCCIFMNHAAEALNIHANRALER
ncbi:transmembrane protein 241 isoform X2 [Silurus meridionalis]|uniref:transmembrane protein 241 isoform X2 n=1 Tax=Silurus meridionalis TaxID=175797 RepID=UPI001EEBFD26|nr:transmembrane protein 241 isoform X2 [Silurus meridionalis]